MGKLTYTASDYLAGLRALLPHGPAWDLGDDALVTRLLDTFACELARIDADIARLVEESDPRTASATLSDWFDEWGIPDDCLKLLTDATTETYRKVLILKITTMGMTFEELVAAIASVLGYDASIGDTSVFTVASTVDDAIYGVAWRLAALIQVADETTVDFFTADDRVSMALAEWGDDLWECLVTSLAPAHINVIFQYGS